MAELKSPGFIRRVRAILRRISANFQQLGETVSQTGADKFPFYVFKETYSVEDNTTVVLYSDDEYIFPDYMPRINPKTANKKCAVNVSLIATALDEADNVSAWVASIMSQTRLPDEIIITDTGSSDGTIQALENAARRSPIPFIIVQLQKGNIAEGRNRSIRESSHEVIAVTDFGLTVHHDWLERLVAPFEIDPETEVSGGWYQAISKRQRSITKNVWQNLKIEDPSTVLSPGASIAFRRQAWEKVGGFPEWLTLTGEDTYFDLELRRNTIKWAFVPQALVDWEAPGSTLSAWKKAAKWASGDGETGLHSKYYLSAFLKFIWSLSSLAISFTFAIIGVLADNPVLLGIGLLVLLFWLVILVVIGWQHDYSPVASFWQLTDSTAQVFGYISGSQRRMIVNRRRLRQVKGYFFIMAGVPIDDTGGGSRFTQIALELIRQQYAVIYLYKYPRGENVDLNLHIRHPNLFHFRVDNFDLIHFLERYELNLPIGKSAVLVEVPLTDWLPILRSLSVMKIPIIYDLVDDWETNLGGKWYKKDSELEIASLASIHTATTSPLVKKLETITSKPVMFLPNAVNPRMFNPRRYDKSRTAYFRPPDAPEAKFTLIYVGALYGSWFDWELLEVCAKDFPEAAILIIGDYNGQVQIKLPNLHFLGLKRQSELPVYLALADVAIIPWKVDKITLAVSPLKMFEFLAMEKPVVVPNLPELKGIPGVHLSTNRGEFLQNINLALHAPFDRLAVSSFIYENTWEVRVKDLWKLITDQATNP